MSISSSTFSNNGNSDDGNQAIIVLKLNFGSKVTIDNIKV